MKANDLNESHIGQRFRFEGMPFVEGELNGISVGDIRGELRLKIINAAGDDDLWAKGYYIDDEDTVVPIGESEAKPVNLVRDKLAEYIQAEFSARRGGRVLNDRTAVVLADIFTELMEGGADAS